MNYFQTLPLWFNITLYSGEDSPTLIITASFYTCSHEDRYYNSLLPKIHLYPPVTSSKFLMLQQVTNTFSMQLMKVTVFIYKNLPRL